MARTMKKLPRYNGFRTMEYMPVVFSDAAICRLVFRPDVLWGTLPAVNPRIATPHRPTRTQNNSHMCYRKTLPNGYVKYLKEAIIRSTIRNGK